MTALRQFSIEPQEHARAKRGILAILAAAAAIAVALLYWDVGWRGLLTPPAFAVVAAIVVLRQSARDSELAQASDLRATVEILRALHRLSFDDACRQLDKVGTITSSTRVRLADPRTWFHPQRCVEFECWPFSGRMTEKFARVGSLFVLIDHDKES